MVLVCCGSISLSLYLSPFVVLPSFTYVILFIYSSVWSTLLRKLSYFAIPAVLERGLVLLRSIIQLDLLDNQILALSQERIWKLPFFDDGARLTTASVEFLLGFMQKYSIQEDGTNNKNNNNTTNSRRERLLHWLFAYLNNKSHVSSSSNSIIPSSISSGGNNSSSGNAGGSILLDPTLVAVVVMVLTKGGRKFIDNSNHPTTRSLLAKYQLAQMSVSDLLYG